MIGISTLTFDLNGFVVIRETSASLFPTLVRRVARTATLDGLSSLSDSGYSDSDGIYVIKMSDRVGVDKLISMIKLHPQVRLCSKEGCFVGVIKSLVIDRDPVEITFLIKEKVSE